MNSEEFREKLINTIEDNRYIIEDEDGNWNVKGFVDLNNKLYTISTDTKVVSKILEIQMFPLLQEFAENNDMELILAEHQNHYPDITFRCSDGTLYAVDIKSTYRKTEDSINGFTLGAYKGYFRDRSSTKNIRFPYRRYSKHFVLGIIYDRKNVNERTTFDLDKIEDAPSSIGNFQFLVQEKYKLASKNPGSGNTKNIGSIKKIKNLIKGNGYFDSEEEFDDFWMNK